MVSPHAKPPTYRNKVLKFRNSGVSIASRPPSVAYKGGIRKSASGVKKELPMVLYADDVGSNDLWMT